MLAMLYSSKHLTDTQVFPQKSSTVWYILDLREQQQKTQQLVWVAFSKRRIQKTDAIDVSMRVDQKF